MMNDTLYNYVWANEGNPNLAWNEWYGWVGLKRVYHYREKDKERVEGNLPTNGLWMEHIIKED